MATNIPPKFSDFGKAVKDLLFPSKDGYDVNHVIKVESKAREEKDIKFTADFTQQQDGSAVSGKLGFEWAHKCNGTLKAAVGTDNLKSLELSYKGLVSGLTLGVSGSEGNKKGPNTVAGTLAYSREYFDAQAKVDLFVQNKGDAKPVPNKAEVAVAAGAKGIFAGAKAVVALNGDDEQKVLETDVNLTYKTKEFEVNAATEKKFGVIKAGYVHRINDTLDVAAQVSHTRAVSKDDKVVSPAENVLTAGASFKYEEATIKVRINSDAELSGTFNAPIRGGAALTLTGRVNVLDSSRGHAVGLQLALK
eukprot:TRINITY_DN13124_c0_g1_i1.p1 TRINITY_DN13124_c0_g1~~TRINITY_DN13124_c0_g1_i1.p1  ORF type:complete len:306 (-),score=80.15 TRINITY_DN13124_c0_g1_i1:43-960(-)